jgi:hypothetical protein
LVRQRRWQGEQALQAARMAAEGIRDAPVLRISKATT